MIRIFYKEESLVEHYFQVENLFKDKYNLVLTDSGCEVSYEVFIEIHFTCYKKYPYSKL